MTLTGAPETPAATLPTNQPASLPLLRRVLPWLIGGITLVFAITLFFITDARSDRLPITTNPTAPPTINDQQRWFVRQSLSEPRDNAALTGYDLERRLYVIGGQRNGVVSAAVDRYDPQTDRWVRLTDKPIAVTYARAVTLRGLIFVPGGEDNTGTVLDRLEIYDPREQRWYTGPSLPEPRSRYALAAWEGQLYLIGGWDGTSIRSEVFVYDPVRERWDLGPALPQPRRHAGVAVAGGRLYIVGGEGKDGPLRDSAWLEPGGDSNRRWIATAPLPQAISRPAAIGLSSTLLVFDSERREGLTYDVMADAWLQTSLPAEAHIFADAVLIDTSIYFVGDSRSQGTLSEYRALYVIFIPR
ncbi:MAG: Kelch repeat-containing protein, partial [Roseiflexus sp.]